MNENESYPQVQMIWPEHRLDDPPVVQLPFGYSLRTYRPGDEVRFFEIMDLAGWPGWDDDMLCPWLFRIVPEGWFMAIHEESGKIVASAMALHDHTWLVPFCGELGWVAADPSNTGQGLGMAVTAATTARFIEIGYRHIHLFTETFRLPALKTYLKLGYIPFLSTPAMPEHWQAICAQLEWPFTPKVWESTIAKLPLDSDVTS